MFHRNSRGVSSNPINRCTGYASVTWPLYILITVWQKSNTLHKFGLTLIICCQTSMCAHLLCTVRYLCWVMRDNLLLHRACMWWEDCSNWWHTTKRLLDDSIEQAKVDEDMRWDILHVTSLFWKSTSFTLNLYHQYIEIFIITTSKELNERTRGLLTTWHKSTNASRTESQVIPNIVFA